MSTEIIFVPHNHFDPTWRRCFDRPASYHGVTVRSYAEVEDHVISGWRRLADAGYTFSEGQTVVLRKYLERHPEAAADLRARLASGNLGVMLAGEVVQDTNLPAAEGLVRNFLAAWPFYRDLVGEDYAGLKLAWAEDAFGNSPNYPQVLKGVGAEAVARISYCPCPDPVWVGIDGTRIATTDKLPEVFAGAFEKHPPCPACKGVGCVACGGSGLVLVDGYDRAGVRKALADAAARPEARVAIMLLTEEVTPDPWILEAVAEFNREQAGRCQVRFGTPVDIWQLARADLAQAVAARDATPTADLNPAMPGCYVSRIKIKQRCRAVAYQLVAAEALLANQAWKAGAPAAPPAAFLDAWRHVAFCQFHDAITGTHVDSAYPELMDMLDAAQAVAGEYVKPKRPARVGELAPAGDAPVTKTMGALEVTFDRVGIRAVRCGGEDVFGEFSLGRVRKRSYCIGELALEGDFGDAWGQRIECFMSGVPLGDFNTSVESGADVIRWRGRYDGGDRMVKKLEWTVTVTPSADGRRLDFAVDANWDTHSQRLRVMVPVASQEDTATWEVPFGFIDRKWEPKKLNFTQWNANTLEFPALHWVCKRLDARRGVALLNRGLPCYRWMPGRLDLSLVRSPEWRFCAVEPINYEFWDIDGQRDSGKHRFEFSVFPFTDGTGFGDLVRTGYEYNRPAPLKLPFEVSGDVVVTAWKPAENGSGWILRVQDAGGVGTEVGLEFKDERSVTVTDLLERPQGEPVVGRVFRQALHRHGILTLHVAAGRA